MIPAMADDCAHVTMLQRSPTYFRTGRNAIEIADELRELAGGRDLDPRDRAPQDPLRAGQVHPAAASAEPEEVTEELLGAVRASRPGLRRRARTSRRATGPGSSASPSFPTATCSRPSRSGKASVVTDEIETLHRDRHPAQVRHAARGRHHRHRDRLPPQRAGRHRLHDRRPAAGLRRHRHLPRHDVHRRPNLAWVFGYFRASWTLRADLVADFVCRLLNHMKARARAGGRRAAARGRDMPLLPWIDPENFNPGYMTRGLHLLPKRGDKPEWAHPGLLGREGRSPGDRSGRPGVRVPLSQPRRPIVTGDLADQLVEDGDAEIGEVTGGQHKGAGAADDAVRVVASRSTSRGVGRSNGCGRSLRMGRPLMTIPAATASSRASSTGRPRLLVPSPETSITCRSPA